MYRFLVVSMHDETLYVSVLYELGHVIYHETRSDRYHDVCYSPRAPGEIYVSDKMMTKLWGDSSQRFSRYQCVNSRTLSNRELEVFRLIAKGIAHGTLRQAACEYSDCGSHRATSKRNSNSTTHRARTVCYAMG